MIKNFNLFISGTEYHFLMCLSIIDSHFDNSNFENIILLTGYRSSAISELHDMENIHVHKIETSKDKAAIEYSKKLLSKYSFQNLFVFHTYRTLESYLIYKLRKKSKISLVEDGALFYHIMEKRGFFSRVRMTVDIYINMIKWKIPFFTLIYYRFHMWESSRIDEIWLTRPELFIGKKSKNRLVKVDLFPKKKTIENLMRFFQFNIQTIKDTFFYISFKVYSREHAKDEILLILDLYAKSTMKKLIVKLHPAARDFQIEEWEKQQNCNIILNNIPAELYIVNAVNSLIVSAASTSLFYNNTNCQYYSLKNIVQKEGLYANWKNVQLPEHVKIINS